MERPKSTDEWVQYLTDIASNDPDQLPDAVWQMVSQQILITLITQMCQLLSTSLNKPGGDNNGIR